MPSAAVSQERIVVKLSDTAAKSGRETTDTAMA
jgi:hypothetical protein